MKKYVLIFTIIIVFITFLTSVTGFYSSPKLTVNSFVNVKGENVNLVGNGIYKNNPVYFTTAAIGFDAVRLFVSLPILIIAFLFYLRGSLSSGIIMAGILLSYFYQYFEFVMAFSYNTMFLLYTSGFSLSLITAIILIIILQKQYTTKNIEKHFPVKTIAIFLITAGFLLLLKCLGETFSSLLGGIQPEHTIGQHTLWDQAMDMGLIFPYCFIIGVLLLRKNVYAYLLSAVGLIFFANLVLSVIIGELYSSNYTGSFNFFGVILFSILECISLLLVIKVMFVFKKCGN
ncbi:MAG: hypothetical protein A2355_09650 [Spirochaetes bacterium RIFOXYB1_FULL_32_8]|nr:MAG: hypothetical protein A2Y30_01460 [Spirochaetes bacterium GWE1_32_154]OHD80920.1 MAG: hypothetical protein A2355_09650 [Spirochaetes bacterium RIFOXYB1_FULL_32_8]